jgi:hypothetical protein
MRYLSTFEKRLERSQLILQRLDLSRGCFKRFVKGADRSFELCDPLLEAFGQPIQLRLRQFVISHGALQR